LCQPGVGFWPVWFSGGAVAAAISGRLSMSATVAISEPAAVPVLMSVRGICKHFGLAKSTVYRWLKGKKIEGVHIGRSHYILVASVHAAIDRLRQ